MSKPGQQPVNNKPTPLSEKTKHSFGWIPDLPDQRDRKYRRRVNVVTDAGSASAPSLRDGTSRNEVNGWLDRHFGRQPTPTPKPTPSPHPASVDLRPQCPPVVDQGQLGSCTANALAGALGFLEMKDDLPVQAFSRLYIYYNERVINGTVSSDSGAPIRDGIKTLAQGDQGACYETTWPYVISQFKVEPTPAAYAEGEVHEIVTYESLQSIDDMKDCLASGYPFVFGFTAYASFESALVAASGVVPMPSPKEAVVGGHAVMAVGYNEPSARFIVRNSWGAAWGQQGYFTMPYVYLTNANLSSAFWTISRGEEMVPEPSLVPSSRGGIF